MKNKNSSNNDKFKTWKKGDKVFRLRYDVIKETYKIIESKIEGFCVGYIIIKANLQDEKTNRYEQITNDTIETPRSKWYRTPKKCFEAKLEEYDTKLKSAQEDVIFFKDCKKEVREEIKKLGENK